MMLGKKKVFFSFTEIFLSKETMYPLLKNIFLDINNEIGS